MTIKTLVGCRLLVALAAIAAGERHGDVLAFDLDDYTRWRLMEGLDDIGLTLRHTSDVEKFEDSRANFKPKTLPIRS